jgi:hypothetical protein
MLTGVVITDFETHFPHLLKEFAATGKSALEVRGPVSFSERTLPHVLSQLLQHYKDIAYAL